MSCIDRPNKINLLKQSWGGLIEWEHNQIMDNNVIEFVIECNVVNETNWRLSRNELYITRILSLIHYYDGLTISKYTLHVKVHRKHGKFFALLCLLFPL